MAKIYEPTEDMQATWQEFLASRPDSVRLVAQRFTPWTLYKLKGGHRVIVRSFDEHVDGTVTLTVNVTGDFNLVAFDRSVFGVDPNELEECELPAEGEILGTALTPDEVDDNIDMLRVIARPDLWELDEHGKAIKRSSSPH